MTANPSSLMVDEGDSLILTFTSDVISTVNLTVYINHTHVDTSELYNICSMYDHYIHVFMMFMNHGMWEKEGWMIEEAGLYQ